MDALSSMQDTFHYIPEMAGQLSYAHWHVEPPEFALVHHGG